MKFISLPIIIISLLLFSFSFKATATVYQWKDENGNVHFSDIAASPEQEALLNDLTPNDATNATESINSATFSPQSNSGDPTQYTEPLVNETRLSSRPSHQPEIIYNHNIAEKKSVIDGALPLTSSNQKEVINKKAANQTTEPLSEVQLYLNNNESKMIYGPARVQIRNSAYMDIIYGQAFIPEEVTLGLLELLGRKDTKEYTAMIIPGVPNDEELEDNWGIIAIKMNDYGHIIDENIDNTDFSKLLDTIKENNQTNTSTVLDWVNKPTYNSNTHALSFSFNLLRDKNDYQDVHQAFLLGRTKIITFSYMTKTSDRKIREPIVNQVLSSIKYETDHRYEDYEAEVDNLSHIKLSDLITDELITAKTIGLLAIALSMLVKFWKIVLLIVAAISMLLLKLRNRN